VSRERLRPSKLHEQLGARLAGDVVSGRFEPGSPIPSEPELVATFGVSKTVVRETVQALASCGLVRVQHGKRTVILPETEWNILSPLVQAGFRAEGLAGRLVEELYEVRLLLEPQAARWTAERADAEQVGKIREVVRAMEESLAQPHVFLEHDRVFHFAIGTTASNRVLRAILRDIHELLNTSWSLTDLSRVEVETVFAQHSAIADAIAAHDGDGAELAMRDHLVWAARTDRLTDGPQILRAVERAAR
jgi:DNA-binding FadR family transcriptional regulator